MKGLQKKEIAEGIEDIAKYLGLSPKDTVFIHSTNTSPNDPFKRIVGHYNVFDHSQPLCYLPRSQRGNTAKAIILFNIADFLKYLDEIGIAPSENYLNLNKQPSSFTYSELSVQAKLLDEADRSLKNIVDSLTKKIIISSYLSQNDLLLKEKLNGSLIMQPELQVPFNSKINLRDFSSKYNYTIPLGVEVKTANDFELKIAELKNLVAELKIDINKVRLWCKLESQSSGRGIVLLEGLKEKNIRQLQSSLIQFASSCKLYNDSIKEKTIYNMKEFTPFVIEIDVESIHKNKIVANIGVEAVISESNVTIVGSVRQITNGGQYSGSFGRYLGSRIDDVLETYQAVAEESAIPVFDYFQSEGYRGFVTIDVLVVEDESQNLIGYNIDPNARFSGGTMLLSLVQYVSKMTGKKFYGITYFLQVDKSDNLFESFKHYADENLFLGKDSNYKGILPLILNNLGTQNKDTIQVAVLSDNLNELEEIFSTFKANIQAERKIPGKFRKFRGQHT